MPNGNPGTHEFVVLAGDQGVAVVSHTFKPGSHETIQLTAHQQRPLEPLSASPQQIPRTAHAPGHTPAWVAFGIGGLGLIVGSVSGGLAFAQKGTVADACPDGPTCAEERTAGNRRADIATGGFIVAGVGAIVGAVLFVAAAPRNEPTHAGAAAQAKPFVRPFVSVAAMGIEGAF